MNAACLASKILQNPNDLNFEADQETELESSLVFVQSESSDHLETIPEPYLSQICKLAEKVNDSIKSLHDDYTSQKITEDAFLKSCKIGKGIYDQMYEYLFELESEAMTSSDHEKLFEELANLRKTLQDIQKQISDLDIEFEIVTPPEEYANIESKLSPSSFIAMIESAISYLIYGDGERREHEKWKILRYDALLENARRTICYYINTKIMSKRVPKEFASTSLSKTLSHFANKELKEWEKQIFSLLPPLIINLDEIPPSENQLGYLRAKYNTFLKAMRTAVKWSEANQMDEGAFHLDALCALTFTDFDLNDCCETVVDTFIRLGSEALKRKPENEDKKYSNLLSHLSVKDEEIRAAPRTAKTPLTHQLLKSANGHLNGFLGLYQFDPIMQSNPRHVLYTKIVSFKGKDSPKKIINIAMGTPTIESGYCEADTNPEIKAFLRHYQRKGLKHYYGNRQDFYPKTLLEGDESVRCHAIHNLATLFKGTFYAVTLTYNSPFYYQKYLTYKNKTLPELKDEIFTVLTKSRSRHSIDFLPDSLFSLNPDLSNWIENELERLANEYKDTFQIQSRGGQFINEFHTSLQNYVDGWTKESKIKIGYTRYAPRITDFKTQLLNQLFDLPPEVSGNYIPEVIVDQLNLRNWCIKLIEQTHKIVFHNKKYLDGKSRRVFVNTVYIFIDDYNIINLDANSSNFTCKDGVDRSVASNSKDYSAKAINNKVERTPDVIKFFSTMLFSRALITHKRPIIRERFEQTEEFTQFYLQNRDELIELYETMFPGIEITLDLFLAKNK